MTRIAQFGLQTQEAISCLINANHYMQALVILYSAIDNELDLPERPTKAG